EFLVHGNTLRLQRAGVQRLYAGEIVSWLAGQDLAVGALGKEGAVGHLVDDASVRIRIEAGLVQDGLREDVVLLQAVALPYGLLVEGDAGEPVLGVAGSGNDI